MTLLDWTWIWKT